MDIFDDPSIFNVRNGRSFGINSPSSWNNAETLCIFQIKRSPGRNAQARAQNAEFPRAFRGADRATYRARVKGRTRRAFHDFLPHSLFIVRVLAEEREPQNRCTMR